MSSIPPKAAGEKLTTLTLALASNIGPSLVVYQDAHSEHEIKGQNSQITTGSPILGPIVDTSSGHNGLEPESSKGTQDLKRKAPEWKSNMTKGESEEIKSTRPEKRTKQHALVNVIGPAQFYVLSAAYARQQFLQRINDWQKDVEEQTRGLILEEGTGAKVEAEAEEQPILDAEEEKTTAEIDANDDTRDVAKFQQRMYDWQKDVDEQMRGMILQEGLGAEAEAEAEEQTILDGEEQKTTT